MQDVSRLYSIDDGYECLVHPLFDHNKKLYIGNSFTSQVDVLPLKVRFAQPTNMKAPEIKN